MIPDWEHNCVYLAANLKVRHRQLFSSLLRILSSHRVEVRILDNVRDVWAGDYCPIQVGPGKYVKFHYDPDYLRESPELRTGDGVTKAFRGLGNCRRSPIILDAGNVVGSHGKAILTEKIYKENRDWSRAELRDRLRKLLQVDQIIVIPREAYEPFGHADAMVRFVDEDRILINDYSKVDPGLGERLRKVLHRHELAIETIPYFHEKLSREGIPSAVGCYANFLRTERVVIAPVFGSKRDEIAMNKLKALIPNVPIVSLDCMDLAREGGVLNCVSGSYRLS